MSNHLGLARAVEQVRRDFRRRFPSPLARLEILRAAHHAARRAYVVHVVEDPPGRLPQAHEVWVEDSTGLVTLARNFVRPTQSAQP